MARYRIYGGHHRGRPWTEDEDQKVVQLFHDGLSISQIAAEMNRERNAIYFRLVKLGVDLSPRTTNEKSSSKMAIVILAAVAIVIILLLSFLNRSGTSAIGSIFNGNNTEYLTQNQLYSIYGIGAYGSISTGSRQTISGSSLNSFISQGSQLTSNFSIPSINFIINTSISNVTIGNSYLVGFNIKRAGQEELLLNEKVIYSPQASYMFFAQSQLASNNGYVNGMQYYVINSTEVVANKDNYLLIFRCEYSFCNNRTINQTIKAISKDSI